MSGGVSSLLDPAGRPGGGADREEGRRGGSEVGRAQWGAAIFCLFDDFCRGDGPSANRWHQADRAPSDRFIFGHLEKHFSSSDTQCSNQHVTYINYYKNTIMISLITRDVFIRTFIPILTTKLRLARTSRHPAQLHD